MKNGMNSPAVRRKMEEDEIKHRSTASSGLDGSSSGNAALERDNEAFVGTQHQRAKQMIREQDDQLEALDSAVGRLGGMASTINEELKDQNRLLKSVDDDLEEAQAKMNFVMAQLSKLLKTKDGCQLWTIIVLAVILILLSTYTPSLPVLPLFGDDACSCVDDMDVEALMTHTHNACFLPTNFPCFTLFTL